MSTCTNSDKDWVEVSEKCEKSAAFDVNQIVSFITHPSAGGISLFIGTTRDNFQEKEVVQLEYEGYRPMAISEAHKICDNIRRQWPSVVKIAIHHKLGIVPVEEASVIIGVSSPHRKAAIDACAFAIEAVKAKMPIWKLEHYKGDTRRWKENVEWNGKRVMLPEEN